MRRSIGLAIGCAAFLFLASAELPAQQFTTAQAPPPPSEPTVTLSPAEQQQFHDEVSDAFNMLLKMAKTPPQQRLHDLLDQALTGDQLPPDAQKVFVEMVAPYRKKLHEHFQLMMEGKLLNRPLQSKQEPISPMQLLAQQSTNVASRVRWMRDPMADRPRVLLMQTSSGTTTVDGVTYTGTETDSEDTKVTNISGDDGKGTKVTMSKEEWKDTGKWVTESKSSGELGLDMTQEAAGKSGGFDVSNQELARVQRCPSADGIVTGKGKFATKFSMGGASLSGSGQFSAEVKEEFTAEGHVQDDAMIKDVKVDVDAFFAQRTFVKGADGRIISSDSSNDRFGGTLTFDPHNSDDYPRMQLTRCYTGKGKIPLDLCREVFANSAVRIAFIDVLRKAYLKAENKWNFKDEKDNSKCVTVKFTPKTKTVRGRPNQSVPVKAELLTVDGKQPTSGHFDELEPVKGGTIQQNGTRTAPGAPAPLIYTAPPQPWPPSDPPGFDVVKATSKAGAFMRKYAAEEEYRWLLKQGLKLSIHHKWEVNGMMGNLLSETTFPIDLMPNERGDLFGQTSLQRTYQTVGGFGGIACVDKGQWAEQWQAYGIFDEKGENLTIKLRFDAGPKQAVGVCGPIAKQHTIPGFSSDSVRTPLDQFKLPAQDGAKQQFVFDFGGFAKNVVDVKLEEVGADKK